MGIVYYLVGAAAGTWVVYNLFHIILFYLLDKKVIPYVAFIGSFISLLVITNLTIGLEQGFMFFIPLSFVWFVVDLRKIYKKKVNTDSEYNNRDSLPIE